MKREVWYSASTNELALWSRYPAYDYMGVARYIVDTEAGPWQCDGNPIFFGWTYIGEL